VCQRLGAAGDVDLVSDAVLVAAKIIRSKALLLLGTLKRLKRFWVVVLFDGVKSVQGTWIARTVGCW